MKQNELSRKLSSGDSPAVVDVRTGIEFRRGHIPGALHCPTWKILLGLAPLPRDRESRLVVLCEHGPRAVIAAKILGTYGYRNVDLLDGHMSGWRRAGLPMEGAAGAAGGRGR